MTNSCEIFASEYRKEFVERKQTPVKLILQRDYFSERLEEGQIDPHVASIPTEIDEAAEKLILKHILDNQRTVYQVSYQHPRDISEETSKERDETASSEAKDEKDTRKDFQSALLEYIRNLYLNPHEEKILAPPVTTKRIFGYLRQKLLHGGLSTYQDTYGRTGGILMLGKSEMMTPIKNEENTEANTL